MKTPSPAGTAAADSIPSLPASRSPAPRGLPDRHDNPGSRRFRTVCRLIVPLAVLTAGVLTARRVATPNAVAINVKAPLHADTYQIYFDAGAGFNEKHSLTARIAPNDNTATVTFAPLPFRKIRALRIDPGTRAGQINIESITLLHLSRRFKIRIPLLRWTGSRLAEEFAPLHHIDGFEMRANRLALTSLGNDPYFILQGGMDPVRAEIAAQASVIRRYIHGFSLLAALLLFYFCQKAIDVARKAGRLGVLCVVRLRAARMKTDARLEGLGIRSGFRHHAWIFLGYGALSLLFFNRIFAGYLYDQTSFLSIWHPWAGVINGNYLINQVLSDQTDAMIPRIIKFFGHRSWWQPEAAFGLPVFALQGGLFFPLRAVFLFFETQTAITVAYLLSSTLSGFAMYVFLRDYRISKNSAFLGGIMYMFAPRLIVSIGTTIGGHILPFLPLYFLAIKKVVRSRFTGKLLVFSLVSALLVLSGFPSIVAFALYLGVFYLASLILSDRRAAQKNCLPIYAFGTLCGFLLSAFVLLQTIEMIGAVADVSYRQAYWSRRIPAIFALHLLNPFFAGNPVLGTWSGQSNLNEFGVYGGLFTWLFLLPGLYLILRNRNRDFYVFPLATLVIVMIIFNFGQLKSLLRFLPIFDKHPATRMAFFLPFFLIPPCMYALDQLLAARAIKQIRACFLLSLLSILLFITASVYLYFRFDIRSLSYYLTFSIIALILAATALAAAYKGRGLAAVCEKPGFYLPCLCLAMVFTLWLFPLTPVKLPTHWRWLNVIVAHYAGSLHLLWLVGVILAFFCMIKKPAAFPLCLLMTVAFVDLYLFGGFYNTPTRRETFYPSNPATEFLQNNMQANERILAIDRSLLPNCHLPHKIKSVQARGLTSGEYKQLMQQIDPRYLARRGTAAYFRYDLDVASPLLDWFNVKYLVAGHAFDLRHESRINQFRHNSAVGLCHDNDAVQTFMLKQDSRIDRLEVKIAALRIGTPLEIEASIWDGDTQIVGDRLTFEPGHGPVGWIAFSMPFEMEGGKVYHLRLLPLRSLEPSESLKLSAVKRHNLFRDGELVTCPEHDDLTFRLTAERPAAVRRRFRKVYAGGISIYENLGAERRGIFAVERIEFIADSDEYIARIGEEGFFRTAYLHESYRRHFDQTTFSSAEEDVFEYLQYDDSRIKIRVRAQSDRFVKIPDTFYPGWTARIDGDPVRIYRTDLIFRGLKLPPGEYVLEFNYFPRPVFRGGLIALLTLLSIMVVERRLAIARRGHKNEG